MFKDKTEADLIGLVWDMQNASNIFALIHHFHSFMYRLRELVGDDEARNHIAIQWYCDKLADLAGRELKPRTNRQKTLFEEVCFNQSSN